MKSLELFNRGVALLLAALILAVSCSMPATGPGDINPSALVSTAGRLIDENIVLVREALSDEIPEGEDIENLTGYEIASRAIEAENGEEYLAFCIETNNYKSVDDVLEAASTLAPKEELDKVRASLDEYESRLIQAFDSTSRALSPSQQEEFYQVLKELVIKTAVLLTAAIVYAFVPNMMFWGKVSAASAVAIAAGILATTILAIVECYKLDMDVGESFEQWLEDVVSIPSASWAIAAAMINLGTSLNRSPILIALILGVFAIFNVTDEVKTMLEFNWNA